MKKLLLLSLFIAVSLSSNAQSTLYVSTEGLDTNAGGASSPFLTIKAAIDASQDGDEILVGDGIYNEGLVINKGITLKSINGYKKTTLLRSSQFVSAINVSGSKDFKISGFTLKGSNQDWRNLMGAGGNYGIRAGLNNARVFIEDCYFNNFEFAVETGGSTFLDVNNSIFYNNRIFSNANGGENFSDDQQPKITHSLILDTQYAVTMGGLAIKENFRNCIIANSVNVPKEVAYFTTQVVLNKVLLGLQDTSPTGGVYTIIDNAEAVYFADFVNQDFTLKNSSPAIGYADVIPGNSLDLLGLSRPFPAASNPDLGPVENILATPVNASPLLSSINDIIINEDDTEQTVSLTGIDDGDIFATQLLTFTATSSNIALIPNPTVTYNAGDTSGSLKFTPISDQSGSAIITVTLTDDGNTADDGVDTITKTFSITVATVNDAPVATSQTISTPQDTNKVITLAATDIDNQITSLTYNITSLPINGNLYQTSDGVILGSKISTIPTSVTNTSGIVIYEPVWNISGDATGNFSFKAYDGELLSGEAAAVVVNTTIATYPIISFGASPTTFGENQSSVVTATLDQASSKDLLVPITLSGTAALNIDYTSSFPSKGEESLIATIPNYSREYVQLSDGRYVFASNNSLIIYNPITKIQTTQPLQSYPNRLKVVGNVVYYQSMSQSILKIDLSQSAPVEESVVAITEQGYSLLAYDVVGSTVYYSVINYGTNPSTRKIYSKTGTAAAVLVYEPTQDVSFLSVDSSGIIYLANSYSIQRIDAQNNLVTNLNGNSGYNPSGYSNMKLFKDQLYVVVSNGSALEIKKFNVANNSFETLGYATTNTEQILDFLISADGNLQLLRQDTNQVLLYNYQLAPQIKIPAGDISGQLTISAIDDTSDEANETIVLTPGIVANASLSSNEPITLTITDNDELPTITFALSASKIVENSATTVTFTATPSVVSGKDITIPFTLSGTATETVEYTVSATQFVIPANAPSASVTISTSGLDDTIVEILETINFNIGTLVNATTTTTLVSLNLESDDNPTITSIVASATTIAEHESTTITGTLDQASSRDALVSIALSGTAANDLDFYSQYSTKGIGVIKAGGNGRGIAMNQLDLPEKIAVDNLGNVFIADYNNNRVQKWSPNSVSGETIISAVNNPMDVHVTATGEIYVLESGKVTKWSSSGILIEIASSGISSSPSGMFIDSNLNIYTTGFYDNSVYKSTSSSVAAVKLIDNPGLGDIHWPESIVSDDLGNLYISNRNGNIVKWNSASNQLSKIIGVSGVRDLALNSKGNLIVPKGGQSNQDFTFSISEYTLTGTLVKEIIQSDVNASEFIGISGVALDKFGNLFVSQSINSNKYGGDYANLSKHRVVYYPLAPQIKILAGQTSGQLIISGIEDDLETEGTEQIVLKMTAQNAVLNAVDNITIDIKDNTRTLTLQVNSPFIGLEDGAVAWGDYDRDGDQDVAVMGTGNSGAVTKVYENKNGVFVDTNQNFTRLYLGDISWVDLNKDGWIDLVVSGLNGNTATPETKVYLNDGGKSFTTTEEYGLPQLFSSKMAWGDLDNDGDIDLAISGIDKDDKYVFNILYKENDQNKFVIEPATNLPTNSYYPGMLGNYQGFINGDLKIIDIDLDGDNDIIYNGENADKDPISNTIYNSYIKTNLNNNYYNYNTTLSLKNSGIEIAKMNASQSSLTIFSSGVDSNGVNQLYTNGLDNTGGLPGQGGTGSESQFPKLKDGDIAVADYNNDGTNDILFIGENAAGTPETKLYFQTTAGSYKESPIVLEGLRNATANWVDYDSDGDLDLFLTGISESSGAKSLLYESDIANKKNAAPAIVSGLDAIDLGNGKIKFEWDAPIDDYSTNLGYVIKIGTTPGGTELSNTESNLSTGARLITKQAPIYTNFYAMQLDPGKYYWSVQAVDTGLNGGAFSVEDSFTLTYEWKILNQGGIIDRSISGIESPVIKLADLDNDNDLDLIYTNASGSGSQILRFDGKRLLADANLSNINSFLYTINYINNINSLAVGDINGDGIADLVRNDFNSSNNLVLNLSNGTDYTSIALGGGLYKSKIKIVDVNNDGQAEIVVLGLSSSTGAAVTKLWIYEYDKTTTDSFIKIDAADQIALLRNASFDLGDFDNDQDIDLLITGVGSDGLKCIVYENITELGGSFTLKATDNNLVAIKDGTADFIDFDGDGDLDAVFTGTNVNSIDVFEIYINKLNEGVTSWSRIASGLNPIRQSKIDLGDFNGDGYSDLLYSGVTGGGSGLVTKLSEFNPSSSGYVDSAFDVSDIQNAEVEFGDLDGDNDLDFVIVGKNKNYVLNSNDGANSQFIFRTYINVRNDSAEVLAAATGKKSSTKKLFSSKSDTYIVNESPSVPELASTAVKMLDNVDSKQGTYPVELSWTAASDDHTPSTGLTYAIKIGTTPGSENIMAANANVSGMRKVSGKGNVEHNKKWRLSLPVGVYYWSVQAIDASYSGSGFSDANQFEITSKGLSTKSFDKAILVKVFPNPTNDIVSVIIPQEYVFEKIEMYNSLGQFVGQYTKSTFSIQNHASGNYFLKIFTSGGITTRKIIKL
jgi:hypothetical protein